MQGSCLSNFIIFRRGEEIACNLLAACRLPLGRPPLCAICARFFGSSRFSLRLVSQKLPMATWRSNNPKGCFSFALAPLRYVDPYKGLINSALCTLHSAFCILHSTLYTLHSTPIRSALFKIFHKANKSRQKCIPQGFRRAKRGLQR